MSRAIEGLNIWITGASSGIGRALALQLAEANNFVIASARGMDSLLELQSAHPKRIRILACDVGNDADMARATEELASLTDELDLVIACAGTCEYDDGLKLNSASYRRVFDANFFGMVNTLRIAMPLMVTSREPVFVGVGSLSSVVGFPRAEAYGASKAAVAYFLDAVRADLSRTNLRVVHVRPGFIKTPLTDRNDFDMPFLMTPEDAAKRIVQGIVRGSAVIDFPRRLSWPLRFFGFFRSIWFGICAPKMTRIRSLRKS